ncbi:hypothetical protein V6N12_062848 [Hibiscus sabdariffa]|uniref:Uncharacterized protein n=1 Tax=Hibiscus sabdariffa TaxID=183260 RepID=A0ABR2FAA4_9ROSI
MANFAEHNNYPQNPRKHRRLDDEPLDTGDPRGLASTAHHTKDNSNNPRIPSYRDKLTGDSRLPAEEEEILDDDDFEILEGDVTRAIVDGIIDKIARTRC